MTQMTETQLQAVADYVAAIEAEKVACAEYQSIVIAAWSEYLQRLDAPAWEQYLRVADATGRAYMQARQARQHLSRSLYDRSRQANGGKA